MGQHEIPPCVNMSGRAHRHERMPHMTATGKEIRT